MPNDNPAARIKHVSQALKTTRQELYTMNRDDDEVAYLETLHRYDYLRRRLQDLKLMPAIRTLRNF